MDATQKAKQMGTTVQNVRQQVKRNSSWEGAQKVGGKLVFPDTATPASATTEPDHYPPEEESKRKKVYYEAIGAQQDAIKKEAANRVASGDLIEREPLERQFATVIGMIRAKVLALPDKLKRAIGDEISERGEMTLERLCDDLLKEVNANGKSLK